MQALNNQTDKPLTRAEVVSNIYELEEAIKSLPQSISKDSPVFKYQHWFVPGLYGREITIPADTLLTTEIHASENLAILSAGSFAFYTEKGIQYYKAPFTMITKVGTKRAMLTYEEVVFTTIHHNPDNISNIDELVEKLIFKDEQTYQTKFLGVL